jgi:hypothetical protein
LVGIIVIFEDRKPGHDKSQHMEEEQANDLAFALFGFSWTAQTRGVEKGHLRVKKERRKE